MRTIFKIAKAELATLFYSPIAWFLSIVFLVQCALSYTSGIQDFLTLQDLGPLYSKSFSSLTTVIFSRPNVGLFSSVIGKIYLYIPLLTMGLISREVSSGTIKLLYSSPIKIRQIVFGKFFAMMIYSFILITILVIFVIAGLLNIHSADIGVMLSSLLGIFLLLCAYAAIGLFMSSLTSYQIVAAIGTLVLFGVLEYVGTLWQGIDFVRDLTYFLSISGRTSHMLFGLISTKDVLYFLLIIIMFLGFCIIKLQAEREPGSGFKTKAKYFYLFVFILFLGYITSLPSVVFYFDASASKQMTLTQNSQKIVKKLGDDPLEVTVYANLVDNVFYNIGSPEKHNEDLERWGPYIRFKPDMKFKYVYYYDVPNPNQQLFKYNAGKSLKQIAQSIAKSLNLDLADFKTPEEIKKVIDLSKEQNRYVLQLKYKGRTTFLRVFDDMTQFPGESEIDAALQRLTTDEVPKIAFLAGEFERSATNLGDKEYGMFTSQTTFRYALVNQGFDVETISLENKDIPNDIASLIIADPKTNFSAVVLAKLKAYINNGGNLLIAGEPGKQGVLNPILQPLGVQLMDGTLVQKNKDAPPDVIKPLFTADVRDISKRIYSFRSDSLSIAMPGVAGLIYISGGPYEIKPLTKTDGKLTWNKKDKLTIDSADVVFSPQSGDVMVSVPTVLALTRMVNNKQQRIVVTGDADFIDNNELSKSGVNFEFGTQLFGWFTYGKYPIDTSRPVTQDRLLTITDSGLTMAKVLLIGILPACILIIGAIFYYGEKENNQLCFLQQTNKR